MRTTSTMAARKVVVVGLILCCFAVFCQGIPAKRDDAVVQLDKDEIVLPRVVREDMNETSTTDDTKDDDKKDDKKDDDKKDDDKKDKEKENDDDKKENDEKDDDDKKDNSTSSETEDTEGTVAGISTNATSGDPPCFPGSAIVEHEDGTKKKMSELMIGDRVSVGGGEYSAVFMFTHKLGSIRHEFVELQVGTVALRLTAGHYLTLNGRSAAAGTARVGDLVELGTGGTGRLTQVLRVEDEGLYNPQTAHGSIAVSGIVASCYTEAVPIGAAHALLAPLRTVFERLGLASRALETGAGIFAHLLRTPMS